MTRHNGNKTKLAESPHQNARATCKLTRPNGEVTAAEEVVTEPIWRRREERSVEERKVGGPTKSVGLAADQRISSIWPDEIWP